MNVAYNMDCIAAYNLGFDFTGYEIDKDYFDAQEERFAAHTAQINLFVEAPWKHQKDTGIVENARQT